MKWQGMTYVVPCLCLETDDHNERAMAMVTIYLGGAVLAIVSGHRAALTLVAAKLAHQCPKIEPPARGGSRGSAKVEEVERDARPGVLPAPPGVELEEHHGAGVQG